MAFRTDDPKTWGKGGKSELITLRTSYISGHVLVVSGAGGGKSAGIVIPTCLTYRKPVVVVDPDGEILARTRAAREAMGHSIRVIKPGIGFDMLKLLEPHFKQSSMTFTHVAKLITESDRLHQDGIGDYFEKEGTKVIAALLEHFIAAQDPNPIGSLAKLIALELPQFKTVLRAIMGSYPPDHAIRAALGPYQDPDPRFFTSFQTTAGQCLGWVPYGKYLDMFRFDPPGSAPILGSKTDVFIQVSKFDMRENPTLVRLMIGTILYVADHRQEGDAPDERLVVVDEAATVGRMTIFESIRDTARKKRLHLMMIFQSQGQIEHLYGRPGLQSWMNGVSARVFSGIEALEECRALSEIVGSYTAEVDGESRSVSSKLGLFSGVSESVSNSNSLREAKLISPDQIRTLPGDAALVLFKGQRPIIAGLALWFRRPEWQLKKSAGQ
jgi:type IV secretion system protein VirD4